MRILGLGAAVALVVAAVLAGGCETTVTTGGTTSYSNDQYGFSFEIADRFEEGTGANEQSTGNAAFEVSFFDPDGAKSGDSLRDGMMVSIYELQQAITPDLMPAFKSELESVLAQLAANDPSVELQPLADATVGGAPGYSTDYTMTIEGMPVQARTYFVVKDDVEYQITIQSSQDTWSDNESDLQAAVDSFTIE